MFRPIPEAALFRRIPYGAYLLLIVGLVVTITWLVGLEQGKLLLVFLVGAISFAAVITFSHYHNTKRTLEEVKGLARNILQSIPTGILTVNRSGVITAVNPTAEAVLKRSAADLLGNSYEAVFANGETIRDVLDGALLTHRHVSQKDLPYEGGHRGLQTIRVSTVELTEDNGQPAGVLLQAQDVTELLGLEQRVRVAEKLTALHTLSAGVAHELRNPLSAMDLNLHLLEEELKEHGLPSNGAAHYLQVLNVECRRLSGILDNFMTFARPGSVGLHQVDVQRVIEHIVALMEFEAEERKIHLERTIAKDLPPVLGDETHISQVLVNIVVNAFHAMANGGRCHIAADAHTVDGARWVDIVVRDTGVGISEDALSRLFEPFYTTKSSGTGLGLAIAYRIMHDHGGSISVSSVPGTGTVVALRFPALSTQLQEIEASL
jgi:PAS domain S-box-containing protein